MGLFCFSDSHLNSQQYDHIFIVLIILIETDGCKHIKTYPFNMGLPIAGWSHPLAAQTDLV